jgi:hypothetical protein
VLLAVAVGYGLLERGNYQAEKSPRGRRQGGGEAEVLSSSRRPRLSDELVIQQAIAMGNSGKKAGFLCRADSCKLLMPIASASALAACTTSSSVVAVDRQPGAALLLPCQDPELVPDPETATIEQTSRSSASTWRAPMSTAASATATWSRS